MFYLGVHQASFRDRDYSRTQEISDALNYMGCEGLIVPSARKQSLLEYVCEDSFALRNEVD